VRFAARVLGLASGLALAVRPAGSADWTPRELRHSFVSLSSDAGVPIEKIARLVGHTGTAPTETVYRKQIRPVVMGGAEVHGQPVAQAGHRCLVTQLFSDERWAVLDLNQ
jgi:integrase